MKPKDAATLLEDARTLLQQWEQFGSMMSAALYTDHRFGQDEERRFLDMKSTLSRLIKVVAAAAPKSMTIGENRMLELLKNSISLQHLHGLPEADKPPFSASWHRLWVHLLHCVGGVEFVSKGGRTREVAAAPTGVASMMGGAKKKKKGGKKMLVIGAIVVAAVVGGFFFLS